MQIDRLCIVRHASQVCCCSEWTIECYDGGLEEGGLGDSRKCLQIERSGYALSCLSLNGLCMNAPCDPLCSAEFQKLTINVHAGAHARTHARAHSGCREPRISWYANKHAFVTDMCLCASKLMSCFAPQMHSCRIRGQIVRHWWLSWKRCGGI